jgi:K+-sensing histidine kinase KdpD
LLANEIHLEAEESQLKRTIQIDETKMCLVVTNLLSNAFKYKQKSLFLKCGAEGDAIRISVRDDGPGIPECYHDKIFDQYFHALRWKDSRRGHGLGLAGAQALTEAMGGNLSLCKSPQGAEFVVQVKCSHEA